MMKYLQLKNGQYIAEHALVFIGIEDGEIHVEYLAAGGIGEASVESAEPCTIDSVIVALRARLAEKKE